MQITGNLLDGGGCTVNISEKGRGPIRGVVIAHNEFGRDTRHYDCGIIAPETTRLVTWVNAYVDGGYVRVRNGG